MRILQVKDYPNVFTTETGKVFTEDRTVVDKRGGSRFWPGKELTQHISSGYYAVSLSGKGKTKLKRVHRIVAETFIDNPLDLPEVNHKDGNKLNNDVTNLEWCTYRQNKDHAMKNNLIPKGVTIEGAVLDPDKVRAIRKEYGEHKTPYNKIAVKYNVTTMTIFNVVKRKTWKHVD